jgi:predicted DCC family thiol-disulfide oxidoreductase YuxK
MAHEARAQDDVVPSCLLIYDGDCRLCVATKEKLEESARADHAGVAFIPYQSEQAKRALGSLYQAGRPDMAFLVEPSGAVRQGLDAFLPLAPGLRGGRFLISLLRLPLAKRAAEWAYRIVARHRYRWFGAIRHR